MQLNILKHQHKALGQKLLVKNIVMFKKILVFFFIIQMLTSCNTVTGSIEGTGMGVVRDVKTVYHYSTCVFTRVQCGDLRLD